MRSSNSHWGFPGPAKILLPRLANSGGRRRLSTFKHARLDRNEIRLLQVLPQDHPSSIDDVVRCRLVHVSLSNQPSPKYSALSYAWGDSTPVSSIIVNGESFSVPENLHLALKALKPEKRRLDLWVDAICIDQSNDLEKSEQVSKMSEIFQKADIVLAWLGPDVENHAFALSKPWQLYQEFAAFELINIDVDAMSYTSKLWRFLSQSTFVKEEDLDVAFFSIAALLSLPFWSRFWIVQELSKAEVCLVVVGSRALPLSVLRSVYMILMRYLANARFQNLEAISEQARVFLHGSYQFRNLYYPGVLLALPRSREELPLFELLRVTSSRTIEHPRLFSSDPRDRVFALLSVASDSKQLRIEADYNKSTEEIYTAVARSLLLQDRIELLFLCQSSVLHKNLPSWVPDWILPIVTPLESLSLNEQPRLFAACSERFSSPQIKADPNPSYLHISGALVDSVEMVARPLHDDVTHKVSPSRTLREFGAFIDLAQASLKIPTPYVQDAVWRIPIADQAQEETDFDPLREILLVRAGVSTQARFETLRSIETSTDPSGQFVTNVPKDCQRYIDCMNLYATHRTPFVSSKGYIGLGPHNLERDDLICVFSGATVPCIIRPRTDGRRYQLVGDAYVHGIMDGEFMEGNPTIQAFTLE